MNAHWDLKACAIAVTLSALTASLAQAAYTVRINGEMFEAETKPTVTIETAGASGMEITITGGIDLGEVSSSNTNTNTNTNTSTDTNTNTNTDTNTNTNTDTNTNTNTDTNTNTNTDTNTNSSVSCADSTRVSCLAQDLGPSKNPGGYQVRTFIPAGQILSIPFSHDAATTGQQYGMVAHVKQTGSNAAGLPLKVWMSLEPGGKPLGGVNCAYDRVGEDAVFKWNQNKSFGGYCRLPDTAGTAYLNYAICSAPAGDMICADSNSKFGPFDYRIGINSRIGAY